MMVAVNITIELMGGVIALVLLISLLINGDLKTREGRLFGCILVLQMVTLFGDVFSWLLVGRMEAWVRPVVRATNFFAFTAGIVAQIVFMQYLVACIAPKRRAPRWPIVSIVALSCITEGLIVASQWNGMVYYLDAENHFHIGAGYIGFSLLLSLAYVLMMVVVLYYQRSQGKRDAWPFLFFVVFMLVSHWVEFFFSDIMISYIGSTLALLMVYANIQAKKSKQLELEMAETRVLVMLSQIQPHFLYNALVAIERLCVKNPQEASAAVASFSTYLRGNLDSLSIRAPIPFAKELEHVKVYLSLEQRRFGDRLRVTYDIQVTDFLLPALTLQTLVENAVLHGVTQREEGGTVRISTHMAAKHWCITIEDDGVGFRPEALQEDERVHVGLDNVRNRLDAMCAGRLEVESEPGRGTVARLYIPKHA